MRALIAVFIVVGAATAHAQSADSLFEDGRKQLDAGHAAEACATFAQAYALDHDALGVILNLGLCNEQLDKVATALDWFRRASARAAALHLADSEAAANDKITALAQRVPELAIRAGAAAVTVDGKPVDDPAHVQLDAGHHVVEARAGQAVERREVDLVDGDAKTLDIAFAAPEPTRSVAVAPIARPAVAVNAPHHSHAYLAGGIGGGLMVGAIALSFYGEHELNGTDHPIARRDWDDTVRYGATSMFAVGALGVAWAVWMHYHTSERTVQPVVSRDSIGVSIGTPF